MRQQGPALSAIHAHAYRQHSNQHGDVTAQPQSSVPANPVVTLSLTHVPAIPVLYLCSACFPRRMLCCVQTWDTHALPSLLAVRFRNLYNNQFTGPLPSELVLMSKLSTMYVLRSVPCVCLGGACFCIITCPFVLLLERGRGVLDTHCS